MDEGPSRPVARRSGVATGIPSGHFILQQLAVTRSGQGDMSQGGRSRNDLHA